MLSPLFEDLGDDDGAVLAGVGDDLAVGAFRALATMSTPIFSSPRALSRALSTAVDRVQEDHAAAGDDAFLGRGAGGVQGVVDEVLAFLHLGLGGRPGLDHRHAAGELGQPLLELLAVVVAGGLLDLVADRARCGPRCPSSCRRLR